MIDWSETNTHWGETGHNIHTAADGSWVEDKHEGAS